MRLTRCRRWKGRGCLLDAVDALSMRSTVIGAIRSMRTGLGYGVRRSLGRSTAFDAFHEFERSIAGGSWRIRKDALEWADTLALESLPQGVVSDDPLCQQWSRNMEALDKSMKGKHAGKSAPRVLVQVPEGHHSPAGYSLFSNLIDGLRFIGVAAKSLGWKQEIEPVLHEFEPTVLLASDNAEYLERIDWDKVAEYKQSGRLLVGLTASLEEYGNTPLGARLAWARSAGVDFYYSFRAPEYIASREEYRAFEDAGFQIVNVEFGANPLLYRPVPGVTRDLNYVFLGSSNSDKWARYIAFFGPIMRNHAGFVDGPGWSKARDFEFRRERDRYIYARAKVGLNLHIDNQISWASELNERTYMLAACGVPQVIDRPGLLAKRFSEDAMFIGETPEDYDAMYRLALSDGDEAARRALRAQEEVFEAHTVFHRADHLIQSLDRLSATI